MIRANTLPWTWKEWKDNTAATSQPSGTWRRRRISQGSLAPLAEVFAPGERTPRLVRWLLSPRFLFLLPGLFLLISSYKEEKRSPRKVHLLGHRSREEKRFPISGNHFEDLVNLRQKEQRIPTWHLHWKRANVFCEGDKGSQTKYITVGIWELKPLIQFS